LDDGALFLDQALLMLNSRADAIILLLAKGAETRTVHAIELGFQPTPQSKAAREVAAQSGQSVLIRIVLGAFPPSPDTLCHDRPPRILSRAAILFQPEQGNGAADEHDN
jgi:hypothetical protein